MRRCRINLSNRYHHLISRVAHRAYFLDGDERTRLVDFVRRVVSQRGATYPVDYAYDEFGDKITMTTFRNMNEGTGNGEQGTGNGAVQGDVTRWLRDEATGLVTNKVYADGKGPRYGYTPDGKLATRTWARGIVTTYSYDDNGSLTNTVYSDGTPTISLVYNRAGRQVRAEDVAGITTFLYDDFGAVTNETVVGVAGTNTIIRHWDNYGRSLGYALNGARQSTLAYDPATGRLASMLAAGSDTPFMWNYLPGSDIKSSLAYPNGLAASWQYDANNQLLQVRNAFPTNTISQYDYIYDAARRRANVSKFGTAFDQGDTISYGYNEKSELTNAVASVDSDYRYAYAFDDIGNRESSSERGTNSVYTANNLNQYTAVDDFTPQFDDDGNQTLIKTATGVWQVSYNGENRPVLWECGSTNISMSFDRMGRRVTKNNQRFVYNGYLQIANFEHQTSNNKFQTFIWDPTEKVATRPLVWNSSTFQPFNFSTFYYTHDGNKNVSEVVASDGEVVAHYEYAPFGAAAVQRGAFAPDNPWRFSSEYAEDDTVTTYYNYRHYYAINGRWLTRDPAQEAVSKNLNAFLCNEVISTIDILGLLISGSSVTGAVYYYGDDTPKSRCPCGKDLVYISDSGNRDNGFEAEARRKFKGSDGTNHTFREPSSFNPNSQLKPEECVCSLLMVAHGYSNGEYADMGPIDVNYYIEDDKNGKHGLSDMFKGIRFCENCTIELRSCLVGLYEIVLRRIADITKCKVKAYKVEVYAEGPGVLDSIFGDPAIEVGPSRPSVKVNIR